MAEPRRSLHRPGPRPVTLSLGARPLSTSLPIISPMMADSPHDTSGGSQSFHAAALSLLDEDGEPDTASSGASVREPVGISTKLGARPASTKSSSPTDANTFYTAPSGDEAGVDQEPSRLSYYTSDGEQDPDQDQRTEHPQTRSNSTRSLKPFTDVDLLLRRRTSFPVTMPDDRVSPDLDAVFEPETSPQRNSMLFPSVLARSRRSSAYTLHSTTPSRAASLGIGQVKVSPLPSPLPSPKRQKFDGLPQTVEQNDSYSPGLPYTGTSGNTTDSTTGLPKSDTVGTDLTAVSSDAEDTPDPLPPRPSAPTPTKSQPLSLDKLPPRTPTTPGHMLSSAFVQSPDGGASPSIVTMADMLQELKRQDSVHPEPKAAVGQAARPLTVKDVEKYATFCVALWWKTSIAVIHSIGKPSHALHIIAFATLTSLLPLIQYTLHFTEDTWTAARAKYRIPSLSQLLRFKHDNSFTLFDCLSPSQTSAGKLALSLTRHTETQRIFDLDAARLLLQLCALLEHRQVKPNADRFAKQGEQYVRLAAHSVGLEYTPVSELNTSSSAYCAAFYDLKSNWIVLAFKGESLAEVDEIIANAMSPSVHLGQHIHGFNKVRACYADRLFPRSPQPSSRIPYHTLIRTVRIIASQLPTTQPIQLYFTGHGSGGAVASLAMAAALDGGKGAWGETVEVGDGYVFGVPTVCDTKSLREFEHKVAREWERPRVLWRVINPNDSLTTHKSWNLNTTTQEHLGTPLSFPAHSSQILLPRTSAAHSPHSTLSAAYQRSPRLGQSLQPERTMNDTATRVRRVVQGWWGVGGVVQHTEGVYWELLRGGRKVVLEVEKH